MHNKSVLGYQICCKTVPSLCTSLDEPFLSKLSGFTAGIWLNNDIGLYYVTMIHTTNIIIFLSPFVRDLIKKLLVHDRTRRLGSMKVSTCICLCRVIVEIGIY